MQTFLPVGPLESIQDYYLLFFGLGFLFLLFGLVPKPFIAILSILKLGSSDYTPDNRNRILCVAVGMALVIVGITQPLNNQIPQPDDLMITPEKAAIGDQVVAMASAEDRENNPIRYQFHLKRDNSSDWMLVQPWSSQNRYSWTAAPLDVGTYTIRVDVTDTAHDYSEYDPRYGYAKIRPDNMPPKILSLTPSKDSPKAANKTINWTAEAYDPDKDKILYIFWLKGPSTDEEWMNMTYWNESSEWTWKTSTKDVGENRVRVYIKDGFHNGSVGFSKKARDADIERNFTITP